MARHDAAPAAALDGFTLNAGTGSGATPPTDTPTVSCPHEAPCGACALLSLGPAAQLARKRDVVGRELGEFPRLEEVRLLPCLPSPLQAGYRNRAKMASERDQGGRIALGYYQQGTRRLVDALECRVLVPEVLETTRALREFFSAPAQAKLPLRFVDVRCGTDPLAQHLTVVLGAQADLPIDALRAACPRVTGISLNVNPGSGPQVLRGPVRLVWGERHVFVMAAGVTLRVSAGAFCQVNLGMLPLIHDRLAEFFQKARVLADLYAGVGTHGLALHRDFDRVLLVEGVSAAMRDARTTIAEEHIANARIVASPVEHALRPVGDARADAVILNPSRDGVTPAVLNVIAASPAQRVAYLSCEPQTLARDLDLLVDRGFRVLTVEPLDMMPQTRQVEALALLHR